MERQCTFLVEVALIAWALVVAKAVLEAFKSLLSICVLFTILNLVVTLRGWCLSTIMCQNDAAMIKRVRDVVRSSGRILLSHL